MIQSNYKPHYIRFTPTDDFMDNYTSEARQYCWWENWEDCDHMQVEYVHENATIYTAPYTYQRRTKVRFPIESETENLPSADEVII